MAIPALLAILVAPASATVLPEKITENTTLTAAASPYTGKTTIEPGVTVTVDPGVQINTSVEGYPGITVKGTLLAEGTAEKPIVFVPTATRTVLAFKSGSGSSVLDHIEVLKGGGPWCCGNAEPAITIEGASPTIRNSRIIESLHTAIRVSEGGAPEIADNEILKSKEAAITYSAGKSQTGDIDIHGNLIEGGGGGGGIRIEAVESGVTGTSLGGNTVKGTEGIALSFRGPEIPSDVTQNTLSGNKTNVLEVEGTVNKAATWNPVGTTIKLLKVTVASGVTLAINPGTHLTPSLEGYSALTVKGTLLAEGTAEKRIVFAPTVTRTTVAFEPGSGSSQLKYLEIVKGGALWGNGTSEPAISIKKAGPTIRNSRFVESRSTAIRVTEGGAPEIADNEFLGGKAAGITYSAGKEAAGNVNIHGNLIEGGGSEGGIRVWAAESSVTGTTLSGNTVKGTEGVGLSYAGPEIPGDITGNTLIGNKSNVLEVEGTVAKSSTWTDGGTVVKLMKVTVAAGITLSVKPGVYFVPSLEGYTALTVKGTLLAEGTAEDPIVFAPVVPRRSITFESGSGSSVLDHVDIVKGGAKWGCCNSEPAISIKKSSPTIRNSRLIESGHTAIAVSEGGSPEIANNEILKSKGAAITYSAGKSQTGDINIHDNVIEGGGTTGGIRVEAAESSVSGTSLGGNSIIGTEGLALSVLAPELPPNITDNTLLANKENLLEVEGTVTKAATWKDIGAPIKLRKVTVAAGVTLKVNPGVYFNPSLEGYTAVTIKGTLLAEGTAQKPIIFSSSVPRRALAFEPGSGSSVLDYVEVIKAGAVWGNGSTEPAISIKQASPTISNSTFRESKDFAIRVTESGAPKIERNRFRGKGSGGVSYSGTGELSAPNNDWGCASGPSPAGCGDSVTGNVKWKPAVQLEELAGHCRGQESQCGEGADPVSLATGQLSYLHRDFLLTNKSDVPLEFVRAYSSGSSADTGLGPGWSQTGLATASELETGAVLVVRQDGRQDVFYKTETGYKAPSGVTDTLTKVEGTFQLTTLDRSVYRFDSSGRIASITDDHGLKTTYGYDANGRLATITDPSAQTLTFAYNASNHITSVKDSTGREVKYTYSIAGDLATVTDALGGVTEYTYDSQHRLKTIKDARGNVILKNTYDSQGRIIEQRDGLENLWKLEYKAGETVVTEPEGGKLTYGFDAQQRVVSETDPLGKKTTIAYDAAGNVKEVVKPGGAKWVFSHDGAGNLTSVEDPEEGERSYEYDGLNRLTGFTDGLGNNWNYEWSAANDLTKITDPDEGETTLTYNESGQPLAITDANGHETKFSYDTRGNRLSVTDPLEHKTSFEYNTRNHLISKSAPGLKAEAFERNALGDLLARTTPLGNKTKYSYDANGLPTQITDPAENVWKIAYNAMARPTTYTDPLEQQTTVSYNGNLKPTKIVNRRGKETTYSYDLANRVTEVHGPEGWDWSFGYDGRGNRTSLVDPRENETTYEYDLADRMIESDEPLEVTTEYGYDANGQLTSVKDPRGNTTSYGYDDLGRLVSVAQPLEKTTLYTYDGVGNVRSRSTAAGTLEYEYDAADRLKEVSDGEATLRAFGYDNADRITAATDAQGKEMEIAYNEDGRVSAINDGRGQSLSRSYDPRGYLTKQVDGRGTLEYGYDKLGRLSSLIDPQGKESIFAYDAEGGLTEVKRPGGIVTTNVFDNAGRLSESITKAGEPATILEAMEYAYDPAGNVVSRIDSRLEQETTFDYDALDRLTEFNPAGEGSTTYGYDAAGNRTSAGGTTYSYNALNQLTSSSDGTTYSYDGAGRLTAKANESEETTYSWDLFDHLASVESGAEAASYAYDALGRLSERTSEVGTQIAHYGDLTDLPTYDTNGEGETTTSYVRGPRGLLSQRSGEATSFPLADAHGDVTAVVNATGEVASRQSFDPWGTQLSGPALEMGYLGAQQRRTDPWTGLIQMGVRSYDPSLGRFLTEDRVFGHLGVGTSFDRYAYVWDNPLNFYDLDGRDVCVPTPFGDACAEAAAEDVGDAAGDAAGKVAGGAEDAWNWTAPGRRWVGERAQDFWKATGDYVTSCVANAAWGAVSGAAIGAGAAGGGAIPGAIGGGLSGCGAGLAQQGLEDAGQDSAADAVDVGTAAKDIGKAGKDLGKEAPELPGRLKDAWDVFF